MKSAKTITLSVLAMLSLSFSRFFVPSAMAQQLDAPTTIQSFPVGDSPDGLASDGENIWVTNVFDNSVTKLRASDGALLGTFPVGDFPLGILFDGTNIWVVNRDDDTVMKLRPSDGVVLAPSMWEMAPDVPPLTEPTSG